MAAHVERVPDLIGWLADLAELVADDGSMVLAVPDRRYTADLHRSPTTTGQLLEARLDQDERPSVRAVYDHYSAEVDHDPRELWQGITPGYSARVHTPEEAMAQVERAREGEPVDVRVWVFTPDTFLRQLRELRLLGLSSWYVEELVPTDRDDSEFRARLHRIPRYADPAGAQPGEVVATDDRPEWVEQQGGRQHSEALAQRVGELEGLLAASRAEVEQLSDRLEARRVRLRGLEERTDKMARGFDDVRESDKEANRQLRGRLKSAKATLAEQEAEIERLRSRPWQRLRRR